MSEAVLRCQGLYKAYGEGDQLTPVLCGVDLCLQAGERVAVIGQSGSGKSTLLHLLGGLDHPDQGKVSLMGHGWQDMKPAQQAAWRNQHLGFIYQMHHLMPELSALENVAMPLLLRAGCSRQQAHAQARDGLHAVGLDARISHRPGELSGGERQRVAVARALVTRPACVLADEPTGNLDRENGQRVMDLLYALCASQGSSVLMVTHDRNLAAVMDRCIRMESGQLKME